MSKLQGQKADRESVLQKDSWDIDYQATLNLLNAARQNRAAHFVLLSAICVQKPLLEFQHAKLKFEAALQAAGDITYSIVRPTAFFKSLAGQVRSHCHQRLDKCCAEEEKSTMRLASTAKVLVKCKLKYYRISE